MILHKRRSPVYSLRRSRFDPSRSSRAWIGVFALWFIFLTGIPEKLTGTPGLIQAAQLSGLLKSKQAQIVKLEDDFERLVFEAERLEKSPVAQQREIRKTLGYAASDEIIFDFAAPERF
ncbi:MAG: hypothetical protein AABZ55_12325 [Bdellovibrionota bacterium]